MGIFGYLWVFLLHRVVMEKIFLNEELNRREIMIINGRFMKGKNKGNAGKTSLVELCSSGPRQVSL